MNNLSVADELRALVPLVEASATPIDDDASTSAVRGVITVALDITAAGVRPSRADVDGAAAQWNKAAAQWADAVRDVRQSQGLIGTTWAGLDAELCGNALTSFTALSERPIKGCTAAVHALRTLAGELEGSRDIVAAGRAGLSTMQGASGSGATADAKRCLERLIAAFEDAEGAGNRAARVVAGSTDSLRFPSQLTLNLVAPFLRAVKTLRVPSTRKRPAPAKAVRQRRPAARPGQATPKAGAPKSYRPKVTPTIKLRSRRPVPRSKTRATVLSSMRKYQGVPYRWGGTTPRGFDCSGFVQYVYRKAGIRLPRTSGAQRRAGVVVPRSRARPGDLVCMPGHVGIYLGNGMMYDAPRTGKTIGARRIWTNNYTIVRVIKD